MHYPLATKERTERREEITHRAYLEWIQRQGELNGFSVETDAFQVVAHYPNDRSDPRPFIMHARSVCGSVTLTRPTSSPQLISASAALDALWPRS